MKSTKPYLVRAIFDWCIEEGFTPHILLSLSHQVIVPRGHDKNNEITPLKPNKMTITTAITMS